ncbi:hypothetical protein [Zobellella endophytica]|uniref:hypothetical protein n=1 Tax=Zobellella endophytica TaxID=2116700 RepID=UPI0011B1FEC2|nr:hypothetical protein [Zobellella endophytica]
MSDIIDLQELAPALAKPYVVTRSTLGATTKVVDEQFFCTPKELHRLYDSIGEKIVNFKPTKAGFQYLISFTDNTHYENNNIGSLEGVVSNSGKKTDKLILNWVIGHELDGVENEMSVTVRISNPLNPFVMLQAAMSKDHSEADNLELDGGAVSISIHGATQTTAEEIFSIVSRWADSCPQPVSITGLNNFIYEHENKISFVNFWIFPLLFSLCAYVYLVRSSQETVMELAFLAFVGFMTIRTGAQHLNGNIRDWARSSRRFSMFMLTGGDENQQTKIAARSRNSSIKLFVSVGISFLLNVAAGTVVALYIQP